MRPSPLELKTYYTTQLSFSAQPGFEAAISESSALTDGDLTVDIQWKDGAHTRERTCLLSIELADPSGKKFPCTFKTALVGLFEVVTDWPDNMVDVLFQANAPALLYSAARESLAMVTGRAPFGKIVLPSVTFLEAKKEKSEGELAVDTGKDVRPTSAEPGVV